MVDLKNKLFSLKLSDKQYNAMLLSYMLKLASFEMTRRKINAELAEKPEITEEDKARLEGIESYISDTVKMIDSTVFTPCLIDYIRKYEPDMLDLIESDKSKIIVELNNTANEAIKQEVEYFGFTREVKNEEKKE